VKKQGNPKKSGSSKVNFSKATPSARSASPSPKNITIQVTNTKVVKSPPKPKVIDPRQIVIQVESTTRTPINKIVKTSNDTRAQRAAETKQVVQNKREVIMNASRVAKKTSSAPSSLSERFGQAASR
jgi:hypothetical protein